LALLDDDRNSGDASYGVEICTAIETVHNSISKLDNLNQVVAYLQQLSSSNGTQSSNDIASVINDAAQQFEQAFGQCSDDLNVTEWMLEVIQNLFCG
jgi:hypothetical protein